MHYCREYVVDLMGKPGFLCEPDSLLNGPSSISISSPLCFPRFRQVEPLVDFGSLAKQYFSDFESLNIVFEDSSTGDLFGLWTCVSQTTDLFKNVFSALCCSTCFFPFWIIWSIDFVGTIKAVLVSTALTFLIKFSYGPFTKVEKFVQY